MSTDLKRLGSKSGAVTKQRDGKLVGSRKLSCLFLRTLLCSLRAKNSKDLQRRDFDVIAGTVVTMVRSCLSETEEVEAFAWDLGNIEVRSRVLVVQVVVVSAINFLVETSFLSTVEEERNDGTRGHPLS